MLELKSTKGKSIPIDRLTEQADRMDKYRDTAEPGFIINFRDHERTYWMPLLMFRVFVYNENRKSIPFDWFEQCWLIPQEIKRTRYRYTIDEVFI
jgi:penicillin-binding protein-related factor A (putative recombinase)